MSCRTTSGGSASTSLARAHTGLSDKEIQQIFHALKREGADLPAPSELDLADWRDRQHHLLDRARRMSATKRDGLRAKLFRARSEPTPDGGTFYAWSRIEARARQEVAIRAVTDAVDLAPPGSQAHLYDLDADGKPTRVWYASYGSNLHRDRFLTYIKGGSPEGSTRIYEGCRDQSLPEEDIPIRFAGARPHFALTSRIWHGGIAFIDTQKGESATGLGRAYAISREQFEDVVAQENGFKAGDCTDIPYTEVLSTGRVVTGTGPYETLLHIGDHDGAPVLTFTAPFSTRDALGRKGQVTRTNVRLPVMTNKPSPAYLRMIGSGLGETFGMDEVAQADYLRGCPGGDRYTRKQIVQILRTPNPPTPATSPARAASATAPEIATSTAPAMTQVGETYQGEIIYTKRATDPNPPAANPTPATSASPGPSSSPRTATSTPRQTGPTGYHRGTLPDLPSRAARPKIDPTARAYYPGVKTYQSGEEHQDGVDNWNYRLTVGRQVRDRLKREIVYGTGTYGLSTQDAEEVLDQKRAEYIEAVFRVDELNAKVRYAKAQTPAVWYSPNKVRTERDWWHNQTRVRAGLSIEERVLADAQAEAARWEGLAQQQATSVIQTFRERRLKSSKASVARAQRKVEHHQRLLTEIDSHLPDTP